MLETWPCCFSLAFPLISPVVSPWPQAVLECCWEPAHPVTPNPFVSFGYVGAAREQVAERPTDENARRTPASDCQERRQGWDATLATPPSCADGTC